MTVTTPFGRLLAAKEKLPHAVRDAVLALGAEAVPRLTALLDDDRHGDVSAPGQGWAPVHAVGLLVDLKAHEAIEPMLRLVCDTEHDAIVHDRILLRLPELGAPVLEPALALVMALHPDQRDTRRSLCAIVARLGVKDDRIFDALSVFFDEDPALGSVLFAEYGDPRGLPRIRKLIAEFKPEFTSSQWNADFSELLHDYEALGGTLDGELRAHVEALSAAWSKHLALTGRVGGVKVGRNDPCPCGSGKKFKKCCAGAAATPGGASS